MTPAERLYADMREYVSRFVGIVIDEQLHNQMIRDLLSMVEDFATEEIHVGPAGRQRPLAQALNFGIQAEEAGRHMRQVMQFASLYGHGPSPFAEAIAEAERLQEERSNEPIVSVDFGEMEQRVLASFTGRSASNTPNFQEGPRSVHEPDEFKTVLPEFKVSKKADKDRIDFLEI